MQPRVKRKRVTGDRVHRKRRENAVEVDKEEWSEIKEEDKVDVKKKVKVNTYSACFGGVHSFEVQY